MHSVREPATISFPPAPKDPFSYILPIIDHDEPQETKNLKSWRPVTMHTAFMATLIFITGLLIAAIAILLAISSRNQGILFAQDINELPLRRSFCYLYLPTLISVMYSFLWTWVDLDIKRLEPYFQLSKEGGATGSNSILLNYPLEFLVTVPFTAFKRRHWNVLSGSVIMMMIFWGLTPTQSGIFAVRTITVREQISGMQSTGYLTTSQQGNLSADYAQSVYNIAWLNETLPPFMTEHYVLSPFGPSEETSTHATNVSYSGATTLYSLNVTCESAALFNNSGSVQYHSPQGCNFSAPRYRPLGGNDTSKPFDTIYVGYQNQNGFADYYLSSECDDEKFFHLFFVRWSKSTLAGIRDAEEIGGIDPRQANETSLFCQAAYYQQQVNATISLPSRSVMAVVSTAEMQSLPADMFNISSFEWAMASGMEQVPVRGDYPTTDFPSQKSQLFSMPLNLAYIPKMAPFAIATYKRPAEDYLNPETLRLSYQSAYQLIFSRQLSDILASQSDNSTESVGSTSYITQAVIVVPGFAYAAICLLCLILLLALGLLITTPNRHSKLQKDPATLGDMMDLVVGETSTADTFASFDHSNEDSLKEGLKDERFSLRKTDCVSTFPIRIRRESDTNHSFQCTKAMAPGAPSHGVRPLETKLVIGAVFFLLQIAAVITFGVLFFKASKKKGLALPSRTTFVRQLVQNYIPIALATFIEPFWLVLNRLLGLLQPFEELRKGNVYASRSVDVDYSSLPPQLLLTRAFRARHYILALVCFMTLLANALAVALSGLMYEGTKLIETETSLSVPYWPTLRPIKGTGMPFNGALDDNSDGSGTVDPFYRKMSNLTATTPLPPWADNQAAFLPLDLTGVESTSLLQLDTNTIAANLECRALSTEGDEKYSMEFSEDAGFMKVTVTLKSENGTNLNCTNFRTWDGSYGESGINALRNEQPGHVALEMNSMLMGQDTSSEDDLFCREHILAGWLRADWQVRTGRRAGKTVHGLPKMDLVSLNETVLLCRPNLVSGGASIIVDSDGHIQRTLSTNNNSEILAQEQSYFDGLTAQANRFLIDSRATWHNDSFPSDYNNYLIRQGGNVTSFLDASQPPPSPEEAAKEFAKVYKQLFAILVATNFQYLFNNRSSEPLESQAIIINRETRILFSTPAFIVTEAILLCYIFTTVYFYARRPWRVLPRLPSTVASNIAYFAASRALVELSETESVNSEAERSTKDVRSSWTWGYGTFIGSDGKRHVGVERDPFVHVPERDVLPVKNGSG